MNWPQWPLTSAIGLAALTLILFLFCGRAMVGIYDTSQSAMNVESDYFTENLMIFCRLAWRSLNSAYYIMRRQFEKTMHTTYDVVLIYFNF
jgi:hypothetical protein